MAVVYLVDWLQPVINLWKLVFGPDIPQQPLPVYQIAARAILIYLIGVAIVRVGKSRLISRVTTVDVLLGFILGSLLSRGITGSASLSATTISSAMIVATHFVLTSLAMRSKWFETLIKGHTRVVMEDGQVFRHNLHISHISDDDLEEELRLNGIESHDQVKVAYKERNGEVSVIKKQP